ncbi:MAG: DUF4956 domain-containing protein [Deltaproteobacteria bacterium]|nr:DUF4956 domain-containing protein [Deltaproteobacteria bacterium]
MDRFINLFTVSRTYSFGLEEIVCALVLPFLLAFGIGFTYLRTQEPSQRSESFVRALFLFAPVISLTTMMIGNNLPRALGMIGALSLIRFRNALKSPLDAIFLFWTLGLGVACGAGYFLAATLLVLLCGLFLLLLTAIDYGQARDVDSLLKVVVDSKGAAEAVSAVEGKLKPLSRRLQRVTSLVTSDQTSQAFTYLIRTRKGSDPAQIVDIVRDTCGVLNVQYLGADASLPV